MRDNSIRSTLREYVHRSARLTDDDPKMYATVNGLKTVLAASVVAAGQVALAKCHKGDKISPSGVKIFAEHFFKDFLIGTLFLTLWYGLSHLYMKNENWHPEFMKKEKTASDEAKTENNDVRQAEERIVEEPNTHVGAFSGAPNTGRVARNALSQLRQYSSSHVGHASFFLSRV
jgi:hypothetical protein